MTLSDISIRKPVFAWMIMIGLIVFGLISFVRMGVSQLPDVDFPVLNIQVTWTGASPETMESAVTDVIEDAVMSVEGIKTVTSSCQEGLSNTTIEFELNRDINVALQEVNAKIAQAQKNLPTDIDPPIVTKSNPDDQPIMWTTLSGDESTLRSKILFARDHLKDSLTTIDGVGDVRLGGYVDPNMRIWLDTQKMRSLQISADDVIAAITSGTILTPSGYLDNGPQETNVRVMSEASTVEGFENIIIPSRNGTPVYRPIHIRDVATVEEGLDDIRRISRVNGESAVGLGIVKQAGSNAVAVGDAVKEKIKELQTLLPKGMKLSVVVDSTKFIKQAIHELTSTLIIAAILTSFVCWLFLGSMSSAINVVLAIPTSLIGAFIFLYFCGFTLNTFTLLALSLSIGIVVDDAIMVLENIVRYHEMGFSRVKAALIGAREITGAAVAASLAILAIFLPVVFMNGIIGKFFFQFGIAMSVAVALSLLEALTLAPMRCSQFLRTGNRSKSTQWMEDLMNWLVALYTKVLDWALDHRWQVISVSTAIFLSSLLLLIGVRKEFVPAQDQSRFLVSLVMPLGSSLDRTNEAFRQAEAILKSRPEVNTYFVAIGGFQGGLVNQGNMFITMKDPGDRGVHAPFKHEPTQQEFMGFVRKKFAKIPGINRAVVIDLSLSGFSASRGFPIEFSIQGPDWEKLASYSQTMMDKMRKSGLMTDIDTDYNPDMPELRIVPDRAKAIAKGVTIDRIATSISAMVGGVRAGRYTDANGHRDDIRVKLAGKDNRTAQDITRIWIRNNFGEMVPLSDLVKIEKDKSLLTINRYNRERTIRVFANVATGKSQADAMDFVEQQAKKILPDGYHIQASGSSQTFKESFQSLLIALVLGIFVAYMVLGTQFNSFIHPITVLLALPFSVTGAFLALRVTGISLNIYSMIGLLLLMGIVKKNSILLVEFTNHRRKDGMNVRDSLMAACPLRLRPILMTSVSTIVAAIPPAVALGAGSETTRPMAVVTIGGMLFSTIFTLVVVPCAYSLFANLESHRHQKELQEALAPQPEVATAMHFR